MFAFGVIKQVLYMLLCEASYTHGMISFAKPEYACHFHFRNLYSFFSFGHLSLRRLACRINNRKKLIELSLKKWNNPQKKVIEEEKMF